MRVQALLFGGVAVLGLPAAQTAQTVTGGVDAIPTWVSRWTPLARHGNLPRNPPAAAMAAGSPASRSPTTGLFWAAGNPGGLPFELGGVGSEFGVYRATETGAYRSPLAAAEVTRTTVSGAGWGRLPGEGGVVGRVVIEDRRSEGARASQLEPHGTNPFLVTDTAASAFRRTRVRLEAAGGWRVGGWGLGLALGYDAADNRTRRDPVPTLGRAASSGAAAGVTRQLPWLGLDVGIRGRWLRSTETLNLVAGEGPGLAQQLRGYTEPASFDLSQRYFRRVNHDERAIGAAVSAEWGALTWTGYAERVWVAQKEHSLQSVDAPPRDSWTGTGFRWSGALEALVGPVNLAVDIESTDIAGTAEAAEFEATVFRADERALVLGIEGSFTPAASPWWGAVRLSFVRERRHRHDVLTRAVTDLRTWNSGGTATVGRRFGDFEPAVAYGVSWYTVSGALPERAALGPVYRDLIHPEVVLRATPTRPRVATFSASWRVGERTTLLIGSGVHVVPGATGTVQLPGLPRGDRTRWDAQIAVLLGEPLR